MKKNKEFLNRFNKNLTHTPIELKSVLAEEFEMMFKEKQKIYDNKIKLLEERIQKLQAWLYSIIKSRKTRKNLYR